MQCRASLDSEALRGYQILRPPAVRPPLHPLGGAVAHQRLTSYVLRVQLCPVVFPFFLHLTLRQRLCDWAKHDHQLFHQLPFPARFRRETAASASVTHPGLFDTSGPSRYSPSITIDHFIEGQSLHVF